MMRKAPRGVRVAAMLASTTLLSGCAEANLFGHWAKRATADDVPPISSTMAPAYKIGKPYQVKGMWYYPAEDWDYDDTGIASWYGPDFHGKATANGEVFDQNAVTAAHKTLPLPSVVRVTNLDNGRSLVVRINDRGPFVNNRIIDLSRRSAQLLGIEGRGIAKVRVQIMAEESRALAGKLKQDVPGGAPQIAAAPRESFKAETLPPPGSKEAPRAVTASTTTTSRAAMSAQSVEQKVSSQEVQMVPVSHTNLYVQAGAFSRYDNAQRLSARLSHVGQFAVQQVSLKGQTIWRVRMGPVSSVEEADRLIDSVVASGHQDAKVIVD